MDNELEFLPELFEQRHVAAAPVAEGETAPHANAVDAAKIACKAPNEFLAALAAEGFVKMNEQRGLDAEAGDGAQFLRQRVNLRRNAIGRDDCVGMAIKRNDNRARLMLPGISDHLPDDLLMAEVDAVKDADGQTSGLSAGRKGGGGVDDEH